MESFPLIYDALVGIVIIMTIGMLLCTKKIPRMSIGLSLVIAAIVIVLFGFAPPLETIGTDRENYARMFENSEKYVRDGYRDMGFVYFAYICKLLTGGAMGAFVISAAVYIFAYLYYTNKLAPHYAFYVFLICMSSLEFTNHYYNGLRAGLAISFALIAISKNMNKYIAIIFGVMAISMHISLALTIGGFILTSRIKNTKLYYLFWGVLLVALLLGVFNSFDQFATLLSSTEDKRASRYLLGGDQGYKVGLRLDFIAYSAIPIIIGAYYIYKNKVQDFYYIHLYNTYLFCNGCWLVVSRMPYNNRLAYLSWFLMPFLLSYPLLQSKGVIINNRKLKLICIILLIAGINYSLKYLR